MTVRGSDRLRDCIVLRKLIGRAVGISRRHGVRDGAGYADENYVRLMSLEYFCDGVAVRLEFGQSHTVAGFG